MTTTALIAKLREVDPDGEREVVLMITTETTLPQGAVLKGWEQRGLSAKFPVIVSPDGKTIIINDLPSGA